MHRIRRLSPLVLALALTLQAGCSSLFDTQYASVELYEAPAAQEVGPAVEADATYGDIANYASLRRAVLQMVTDHVESAQLQFTGYEGTISQDISTACWEVKSSTALGAFAVDYISYDLSRIVSYYQAEVNVTYKRSAAQVAARERAATPSALTDRLDRALRAGETYLVLEIADASATADTIRACASEVCFADPLACPVLPELEIGLFPETGVDRIAEVSLNYGLEPEELEQRRKDVDAALAELTEGLLPEPSPEPEKTDAPAGTPAPDTAADTEAQADRLETLCARLMDRCSPDERAGSTAWDALTSGAADSQGLALALAAGCRALGLDCQVVAGRMGSAAHYWLVVALDGTYYHVDASAGEEGVPDVFLAGDEQLWGDYWWDTSQVPACPKDLRPAREPAPTPAPEPVPAASPSPAPISL